MSCGSARVLYMTDSDYKASKEAFVSGATGSTVTHVNFISAVALCSIALHAAVRARINVPESLTFVSEWTLLALPLLLSMTLFADMPLVLCLLLLLPILLLYILPYKRDDPPPLSPIGIPRALSPSRPVDVSSGSNPLPAISPGSRMTIPSLPSLTIYRSHMLLMTFIAILAVDFPIFPRSLSKCETFGVSLMDLGVGSFVFSQGVVSAIPILKDPAHLIVPALPKIITVIKKMLPVFFLGIIRVISVKGTEYPEHESEYGTHWNFFFTLALLPILQVILHPAIAYIPISLLGFLVALSHQIGLSLTPLQYYALNAPRTNLLSANKEGLISLAGYLAIHLLGLSTGTVILPPSPSDFRRQQIKLGERIRGGLSTISVPVPDGIQTDSRRNRKALQRQDTKTITELFSYATLWWTCLGICYLASEGGGVSRRLANLPYVVWVAAYNTSFIMCYLVLDILAAPATNSRSQGWEGASSQLEPPSSETFYKEPKAKPKSRAPALLNAINLNGLALFLLANVGTGLINLSMSTMYASNTVAMLVLSAYSFSLCLVAWMCRENRIWRM
ncbi:hypothetical protein EW145_g5899 [Phellinidium pouzarii]|uniref:GPI-anchored wall transfer protein n=1 Tax=Phellinidium pouzarii TaxID=167371 RepID=A0A4S4KYL8_9AGAM|nr:hypothetical protein EW145_g5899 [Phellinidium pouzarii]